ncbi:hypothetical protein [Geomonas agri]|uniref:hypothetical protein n=1 Tax=Geomonas agri TaxID=2873702 RepID=UPI001CD6286A|nr:hypothetical protein [Geomonas agri]
MSVEQFDIVVAFAAGALGGMISYLMQLYNSFTALPTAQPNVAPIARNQRIYYCLARVAVGGVAGLMAGFWLLSDHLETGKFIVSTFGAGASLTLFTTFIKKVR